MNNSAAVDQLDELVSLHNSKVQTKMYYIMDGKRAKLMRTRGPNLTEVQIACDFFNGQYGNNDKYDIRFYIVDSDQLPLQEAQENGG